ncbi:MAG TPA: IS21-like element helper ATPase IstB [Geodermatophilus sp.]|nr:IS21-like element helper ATPase IstB [Geodermatophilus sp.]
MSTSTAVPATATTTAPPASQAEVYQRLRAHLAFLKLTAAAEALPDVLDAARDRQLPALEAIESLLGIQVTATEQRQITSRLHFANLPAPWTIDDYDFSAQPGVDEKLIRELATLRFLDDAANLLFIGPPGVGKTMLSICLARLAAEYGHKAYFTTCEELIRRLKRATAEHRLATGLRFFTQPRLLVLDEFGYRRLDEDGRSLLFEVVNARYLKGSIITTCHVGINGWAERLGDPMLAAALIDRLLHRGVIVGIDGPSYRMRSHQARANALRTAVNAGKPSRTSGAGA